MRLIHVSDTHLGAAGGDDRRRAGDAGWRAFAEAVVADPPELVVVTGDIVVDAPDDVADQEYAQRLLGELTVPVMILPGNHDVGDHPVRDGLPADWLGAPVTAERVAAWEERWGPGHQARRLGAWTLIGLNSQLLGTGLDAERAQWEWLVGEALPAARGTRIAVFMHESLHLRPEYADGTPEHGWMSSPRAASVRLADVLREAGVDLVATGHTHRYAEWTQGGIRQLTAPSLAGPIPIRDDMTQAHGDRGTGWLEYELDERGATVTLRALSDAERGER